MVRLHFNFIYFFRSSSILFFLRSSSILIVSFSSSLNHSKKIYVFSHISHLRSAYKTCVHFLRLHDYFGWRYLNDIFSVIVLWLILITFAHWLASPSCSFIVCDHLWHFLCPRKLFPRVKLGHSNIHFGSEHFFF